MSQFQTPYEHFFFDMLHSMEPQVVYEAVLSFSNNNLLEKLETGHDWLLDRFSSLAKDCSQWDEIRIGSLRALRSYLIKTLFALRLSKS